MTQVFFTGFTLMLSLILAIGAQNAFVLQQGVRRQYIVMVVLTCFGIDSVLMVIGVLGLGTVISSSATLLRSIAIVGGVALAYYGFAALARIFKSEALDIETSNVDRPRKKVLSELLAISLLNPHVYLDTVILVGSVGAQQPENLRPIFILGSSLASLVWFAAIGFGGALFRPVFAKPLAWRIFDSFIAVMMFSLAYKLIKQALSNTVL